VRSFWGEPALVNPAFAKRVIFESKATINVGFGSRFDLGNDVMAAQGVRITSLPVAKDRFQDGLVDRAQASFRPSKECLDASFRLVFEQVLSGG